jgi:O-antigen ligase
VDRYGIRHLVRILAVIAMKVTANLSALKQTKWYEYAIRFLIGGAITVLTGIIAKKFGPTVGGLFLAFPAIFPASATLIEKHEKQKKERAGMHAGHRGQDAAALDAAGAAMGSIGLIVFAVLAWFSLPRFPILAVLAGSAIAWLIVSVCVWIVCEQGPHVGRVERMGPLKNGQHKLDV